MIDHFSYIHFQEDSYVEFQGFHLHPQNNISLEFQTTGFQGVLLYIEQRPTTVGRFFIQLYINHGFLQYQFACDVQEEIRNISTNIRVNDGRKYKVRIRQDLVRCEAEVTLLGITTEKSTPSNHWSSLIWQATGPIFIGGLPHRYARKQVTGSMCNFTGCLEITEINNIGPFTFRKALDRHNIKSCRFSLSEGTSAAIKGTFSGESEAFKAASSSPTHPGLLSACPENLCQNGGTCQQINLPGSVASFQCDCPLHFTGRFCEKDTTLFFPSFSANSYLELPSLSFLAEGGFATGQEQNRMTIYLTVKTSALNGTLLYTSDEHDGENFLHLYLVDGRPTAQFGCGTSTNVLTVTSSRSISRDTLLPITISYMLPFDNPEGYCLIEMMTDENVPLRRGTHLPHQLTQVNLQSGPQTRSA
nr:protein eyes shut homolog [Pogona vitticeps]